MLPGTIAPLLSSDSNKSESHMKQHSWRISYFARRHRSSPQCQTVDQVEPDGVPC
jgi:hypothetical protein